MSCNLHVITMLHSIHSIDATKDRLSIGRLINHSRTNPNLIPKVIELDGKPRLYFVASKKIAKNEELLYNYGEIRKDVVKKNRWLKE